MIWGVVGASVLILTVLALTLWVMRGVYYFKGRLDEVEAIAHSCSVEFLPIDLGIYRAFVLHQVKEVMGITTARRYIDGEL